MKLALLNYGSLLLANGCTHATYWASASSSCLIKLKLWGYVRKYITHSHANFGLHILSIDSLTFNKGVMLVGQGYLFASQIPFTIANPPQKFHSNPTQPFTCNSPSHLLLRNYTNPILWSIIVCHWEHMCTCYNKETGKFSEASLK